MKTKFVTRGQMCLRMVCFIFGLCVIVESIKLPWLPVTAVIKTDVIKPATKKLKCFFILLMLVQTIYQHEYEYEYL
jgi:hypothetical protein